MRTCPNSSRLTALREGWLLPHESTVLLAHIEDCPDCRRIMAELDTVAELLARESGPAEEPPGGYAALLRSTLAMWERMPVPVRRFNGWFRRTAAVAAVVMLVATALLVSDQVQRGATGTDTMAGSSTESGDLLDQLIEEHALATDQVPFSDGAYLAVMAQRDRRR